MRESEVLTLVKAPNSSDIHGNTVLYSQESIVRLSEAIVSVIASLLLVGSIVVLYFMSSMDLRLIIIGLFTASFSLGLGLLTNGRIVEVFSATAT